MVRKPHADPGRSPGLNPSLFLDFARYVRLSIHGGKFVGGAVSATPTPTPEELADRQYSVIVSYINSLDVSGGEFIGKILVLDSSMRVHGRELTVTPPPTPIPNSKRFFVA